MHGGWCDHKQNSIFWQKQLENWIRNGTKSSIVYRFTEKVGNCMFAPVYVYNFFQFSFQQLKFCFVEITTLLFLLINSLWLLCWAWNHQNLCGLSCLLFPCWGRGKTQWLRSSHYLGKSWSFLQFFFWAEKLLSIWWSEKEMTEWDNRTLCW